MERGNEGLLEALREIGDYTSLSQLIESDKIKFVVNVNEGRQDEISAIHLSNCGLRGTMMRRTSCLLTLRTLDLSKNDIRGFIPESIGSLSRLTSLNLSQNQLTGQIPSSLRNCSNLMNFNISSNSISGEIPGWIDELSNLTVLSCGNNKLSGEIPYQVGNLKYLKSLILHNNFLCGRIPDSIGNIEPLSYIYLDQNRFHDDVPATLLDLPNLKVLYLSHNRLLRGVISIPSKGQSIQIEGTMIITEDENLTRSLNNPIEYSFVFLYIIICYLDLIYNILSIVVFKEEDYIRVFGFNIACLILNFLVGIANTPNPDELGLIRVLALNLCQFHTLIDGFDTLRSGHRHRTSGFVNFKQVDVIIRCIPSMICQLYTMFLILSHPTLPEDSYMTLKVAVGFGVVQTSLTLTSLVTRHDKSLMSVNFLMHFLYFLSELMCRLLSITLMLISLGSFTFIIVFLEFVFRLVFIHHDSPNMAPTDVLVMTLLNLGSDHLSWYKKGAYRKQWERGSHVITCELLTFLFFLNMNVFETNKKLEFLLDDNIILNITIAGCVFWFLKLVLFYVLEYCHSRFMDLEYTSAYVNDNTDKYYAGSDDINNHETKCSECDNNEI